MIFLNTGVSAIFTLTKACTVRQKIKLFFKREKNNEEKIEYKYLAEQLCTCFKLPSPGSDKELTFNTPFGDVKFNIMAKGDIFISSPGINKYVEIAKALDEILTEEGRKQLAGIILEYLLYISYADTRINQYSTCFCRQVITVAAASATQTKKSYLHILLYSLFFGSTKVQKRKEPANIHADPLPQITILL